MIYFHLCADYLLDLLCGLSTLTLVLTVFFKPRSICADCLLEICADFLLFISVLTVNFNFVLIVSTLISLLTVYFTLYADCLFNPCAGSLLKPLCWQSTLTSVLAVYFNLCAGILPFKLRANCLL